MSYQSISVKDAINSINNSTHGWFLPAIQRPYVWGSRYENEIYICKLFDSILKSYPIGGLIIWNTEEEIPYREFITNYVPGEIPKLVDKGLHSRKDKWLIYDGQQRLQTLFSCLRYTFNNKILVYDLLYNSSEAKDASETGFSFVHKNGEIPWHSIRMNELFSKLPDDDKRTFRKSIMAKKADISDEEEALIEGNVDKIWDIFVKTDLKSLAYFPIKTSNEDVVNEVFERLNTGGMALSLSDLLFTEIKKEQYDFEEDLQVCAKKIYDSTGKGYLFSAYNILQLLNLLVKKAVRIDPKKVKQSEIKEFITTWDKLEKPLVSFFTDYLWGQFRINNASIIPRNLALLPIVVYFYEIFNKGYDFKKISSENLRLINQYLIKSQINDWNLQSYADNFTKIIRELSSKTTEFFNYPLKQIEEYISEKKSRYVDLYEDAFVGYIWFGLKILMPGRVYLFEPDMQGRFNPEIDHIFPKKLNGRTAEYESAVDFIWNMQPTKGEINGFKTNHHPKDFFCDKVKTKNGETINGSKYINEYDFLFPQNENGKIDFNCSIWDKPLEFIQTRRKMMVEYLKTNYGIEFIIEGKSNTEDSKEMPRPEEE
ncbi:MAG: DUF262 domain-containing protein [Clostridiaceae bacterium]|nr:DUF262 domain-containing protein [Clostridiaceae bacterium]